MGQNMSTHRFFVSQNHRFSVSQNSPKRFRIIRRFPTIISYSGKNILPGRITIGGTVGGTMCMKLFTFLHKMKYDCNKLNMFNAKRCWAIFHLYTLDKRKIRKFSTSGITLQIIVSKTISKYRLNRCSMKKFGSMQCSPHSLFLLVIVTIFCSRVFWLTVHKL